MANNKINETSYLNASHISELLGDYEAARSGFFTLIVQNIDDLISATESNKTDTKAEKVNVGASVTNQEILSINVTKASVPHFSLEVLEYKRGNETVKFAGTPSFEAGSLTIDDIVGLKTKDILLAWQAQAYDVHSGKGGRMKDYKKTCTLIEYTQDYEQIRTWELRGCWISELSEDTFDKEADSKRQITATLQYDKAIPGKAETAK